MTFLSGFFPAANWKHCVSTLIYPWENVVGMLNSCICLGRNPIYFSVKRSTFSYAQSVSDMIRVGMSSYAPLPSALWAVREPNRWHLCSSVLGCVASSGAASHEPCGQAWEVKACFADTELRLGEAKSPKALPRQWVAEQWFESGLSDPLFSTCCPQTGISGLHASLPQETVNSLMSEATFPPSHLITFPAYGRSLMSCVE